MAKAVRTIGYKIKKTISKIRNTRHLKKFLLFAKNLSKNNWWSKINYWSKNWIQTGKLIAFLSFRDKGNRTIESYQISLIKNSKLLVSIMQELYIKIGRKWRISMPIAAQSNFITSSWKSCHDAIIAIQHLLLSLNTKTHAN